MKVRSSKQLSQKRAFHNLKRTYLGYGIWLIIILSLLISSQPASGSQLVSLDAPASPTFADVALDH